MEMTRQQLEYRILSSMSGVPLTQLLAGYVPGDEAWSKLSEGDLGDGGAGDRDRRRGRAHRLGYSRRVSPAEGGRRARPGVIDYVQLMPGTLDRRGATRNEEITDISRRLKIMAGEIADRHHPALAALALGRRPPDPAPEALGPARLGRARAGRGHRRFLHRRNHREGGTTNFILEKQRNGPTGTVNLTLDRDITLFTDGGEEPPPSASPQMGVTSAFTFGKGYGGLLMLLTALDIPFDQITPRKWQTAMGCLSGGDKNVTKRRAQQLFPKLTITHAIADALLLAEFCRRVRGSEYGQEEEPDTETVKEAREGGESIAQQDSEQGHAQSTGEASPIREDRDRSRPPARSARRRAARHGGSTRQGAR
jgi:hypothetical protein